MNVNEAVRTFARRRRRTPERTTDPAGEGSPVP